MAITKSIRNRLVGVLVILSLILILVPLLNPSKSQDGAQNEVDKEAIAITSQGAVTDDNGQLVSVGEKDYSDLLDPVDDTKSALVSNNDKSPFDAVNKDNLPSAQELPAQNQLETTAPITEAPAKPNTYVEPTQTVKTEVLTSNRTNNGKTTNTQASRNVVKNTQKTSIATGSYAAQVGAFTQKEKIQAVMAKLTKAGFKPVSHNINVNGKALVRIYAGSAKDRNGALAICNKVKAKSLGLECQVSQL